MTRQEKRLQLQQSAVTAFLNVASKHATLEIGTGVGKGKIALDIVREMQKRYNGPVSVLILVDNTRLRDTDWPEQFTKFGFDSANVTLECYQTAYKWKGKRFPIVIADEFDASLTAMYSAFYANNDHDVLIGLTAYINEEKRELADKIAPTCFKYTTQEAQKDGILNQTRFYQVNFDIGHTKSIEVKFGKNKERRFFQSENGMYSYLEDAFNKALWGLKANEGKLAQAVLMENDVERFESNAQKSLHQMKMFSRKRTEFLHTLKSSREVTKALISNIHSSPGNKILIFSKRTDQIDQITEYTHHAKNKPKTDAENKILALSEGRINTCGVCEAVNRGANLVGVNKIIQESYVGSDTNFQQKHGRGMRLNAEDTMDYFILVPHYWARVQELNKETGSSTWKWVRKPTQAKKWFDEMTAQFDMEDMKTIEMVHDRRTDKYTIPEEYDNLCRIG